jgi:hypothetical protein
VDYRFSLDRIGSENADLRLRGTHQASSVLLKDLYRYFQEQKSFIAILLTLY